MTDQIQESISRIEETLFDMWRLTRLSHEAMWGVKEVAVYLGVSETQVRTWSKTVTSFPDKIRVENDNGLQAHPMYEPEKIKAWIRRDEFRVARTG